MSSGEEAFRAYMEWAMEKARKASSEKLQAALQRKLTFQIRELQKIKTGARKGEFLAPPPFFKYRKFPRGPR